MDFKRIVIIDGQKSQLSEINREISHTTYEGFFQLKHADSMDLVLDMYDGDCSTLIKRLQQIESSVSEQTVIGAYSTHMSATEIVSNLRNPERFAGIHFFNFSIKKKLVEIVKPENLLNQKLLEEVSSFLEECGYAAVIVKDRPGLLANRLLIPYINQAVQAFDDEIATAVDIDHSVCLGLGYPIGPLKLLDQIGVDEYVRTVDSVYAEMSEKKYAVPPILNRMVSAKKAGQKNGVGFYEYKDDGK